MISRIVASLIGLLFVSVTMANESKEGEEEGMFKQKPIYVSMLPHFLVNLALKLHMAAVRHEILMKLSHLGPDEVRTSDQKETLRQDITETIRVTLRDMGESDDVKGFYITSIVIQ